MPVYIKIDGAKCAATVKSAWEKGLFALSSQVLGDCNQYVKIDSHDMERSSYTASVLKDGKLIWDTIYAKRQYWAIETSLTPGRTWKWCETAKTKHLADWAKIAEKGLRENL